MCTACTGPASKEALACGYNVTVKYLKLRNSMNKLRIGCLLARLGRACDWGKCKDTTVQAFHAADFGRSSLNTSEPTRPVFCGRKLVSACFSVVTGRSRDASYAAGSELLRPSPQHFCSKSLHAV
jgi:hypothetical protein